MRFRPLVLLTALTLAACSGPLSPGPQGPSEPPPPERPSYPEYETFDPGGYDAQPTAAPTEVDHDVPARLMEGRVNVPGQTPTERMVDGFRVQIFSSESPAAAEEVRDEAMLWWEEVRGTAGAPDDLRTEMAYLQPYYRVRLGAFEFRADAERALAYVRARFPEAFIVPDRFVVRD